MSKKISLVTVTYNSAATLRDTIESVLNQDYPNLEYIVVDGKSTDNTLDIIKEYEPKFEGCMRWISEPDKGLYDAMNKGIRMATGDIVGILNSDDFYHRTDTIAQVAEAFENPAIEVVYGDLAYVSSINTQKITRYYSSQSFKPWKFRFGFMPAHPTFFTLKTNFDKFGYYKPEYKVAADFELLLRFLKINKLRVKYLPFDFLRMRDGGVSTSLKNRIFTNNKEIARACRDNGVWTCLPLMLLRYPFKIIGFIRKNRK